MTEERKEPKLRFPGFTDPWEQRKLGDVFKEYSDKGHPELPALTIVQGGGTVFRDESDRKLQYDKANLSNYKKVNVGDFIVHLRSFEGGLEIATNTGVISPAYHTFHGENTDSRFYYSYFRSKRFINTDLKPHVYGIRDGRSIDIDGMKTIQIPSPSYKEQKAIGDFLDCLDNTITLHQRKCDEVEALKNAMLQKMFPKEGKTVPEVRFPGFTGAWKQKKLGDMVSFSKGSGYSKGDLKENGTPIILYGRLYTKYETVISEVDTFVDEKKGSVFSKGGEVIVPASGETAEDISIAAVVKKAGVLLGGDLNIITPPENIDSAFLAISISNGKPHSDMAKMAQGKSVVHLHNSDLEKIDLPYPSYDEQRTISGFFSDLDSLVTLHQRKCDELKKIKKSLLQQMFA